MNKMDRFRAIAVLEEADTLDNHKPGSEWMKTQAKLVEKYISNATEATDEEKLSLVYALNSDVQVRDYAMGLIKPDHMFAYTHLLAYAPTNRKWLSAQACLVSQIHYESGDKENALQTLELADTKYPLAQLLRRVYKAGWNPGVFAEMRQELHPQVVQHIFGEAVA